MSETGKNPHNSQEDLITRRDLVTKKVPAAAITAVTVDEFISHEIQTTLKGVYNPDAHFTGIFEGHQPGVTLESIPHRLDIFFKENAEPNSFITDDLPGNLQFVGKAIHRGSHPDLIARLARERTQVMFGDMFPEAFFFGGLDNQDNNELLDGLASLATSFKIILNGDNKTISRRAALGGLLAFSAWSVSPTLMEDGIDQYVLDPNNTVNTAIQKIAIQITGLLENVHPEETPDKALVFYRNVHMANNLLRVAHVLRKETGKRLEVGYLVGAAHSELKKFIEAGPIITRCILTSPSVDWLRKIVTMNGGIEDFSSAILLQLPSTLTLETVNNAVTLQRQIPNLTFRKVTDPELEKMLDAKLNH